MSPSQVHAWKKQLLDQGSQLFDKLNKSVKVSAEHVDMLIRPTDNGISLNFLLFNLAYCQ